MMRTMLRSILFTIILFICSPVYHYISAQEEDLPLVIEPLYPDSQIPETIGYFDMTVEPGDREEIGVRITNENNREVKVNIQSANAYTYPTGGIVYDLEIDTENTSLLEDAIRLADYIEVEEAITIPALSSVDIPINITVPDIEGETILGGIRISTFSEEGEQTEAEEGTANFVINTETIHAIAVQLNLPKSLESEFSLGQAGFISNSAQVFIEMFNKAHKIQDNILGEYRVTNNKGEEIFEGEFGPFNMAPNTKIRYPFNWNNETLDDGDYVLDMEVTIDDETIKASENFTIHNEDVEEYAERTEPIVPEARTNKIPTWMWGGGIILFGIIMFTMGRRK
ncbi:WxL protein peptidoglycan domain-containing protein [Oceanobacillus bengalensis]|nr:DUF916 domain-containing protein [Oceanobacillus bengalensis]